MQKHRSEKNCCVSQAGQWELEITVGNELSSVTFTTNIILAGIPGPMQEDPSSNGGTPVQVGEPYELVLSTTA